MTYEAFMANFGGADGTTLPEALKLFNFNKLPKSDPANRYIKRYIKQYSSTIPRKKFPYLLDKF